MHFSSPPLLTYVVIPIDVISSTVSVNAATPRRIYRAKIKLSLRNIAKQWYLQPNTITRKVVYLKRANDASAAVEPAVADTLDHP